MRAQELANDLAHALEVVEAERDEAIRERDEAQAVIDAVREARGVLTQERRRLERSVWPNDPAVVARLDAVRNAIGMLDGVDGL
jgi:hypothetical protein